MNRFFALLMTLTLCACGGAVPQSPPSSLVAVVDEPAGANCAAGGKALQFGKDLNRDDTLGADEVTSVDYLCNPPPPPPPPTVVVLGNVADFSARAAGTSIALEWRNPVGPSFAATTVRRATAGFPASPTEGDPVYDGIATTFTDPGLTAGTPYYYRAFARDSAGHFAPGVDARATPGRPGSLDPSFSGDGLATFGDSNSVANQVLVSDGGRVLVLGRVRPEGVVFPSGQAETWSPGEDGALDRSWGVDGISRDDDLFGASGGAIDRAGRLVYGSATFLGVNPPLLGNYTVLVRLAAEGTSDRQFGDGGWYLADFTPFGTAGTLAVAIDAADKVVALTSPTTSSFVLLRVTSTGAFDSTFADAGYATVSSLPGTVTGPSARGSAMVVHDDSILVAGYGRSPNGNYTDAALWRFVATTGALDTAFSGDGVAAIGLASTPTQGRALTVDGSGRVVMVGIVNEGSNTQIAVWRFTAAGAPDSMFDTDGLVVIRDLAGVAGGYDIASAVAVNRQGRILVAGGFANVRGDQDAFVLRLLDDGSLDSTFATAGFFTDGARAGIGHSDSAISVAVDGLGRILVAGSISSGDWGRAVMWRLMP